MLNLILKVGDGLNSWLQDVESSAKKEGADDIGNDKGGCDNDEANDGVGEFFHGFAGLCGITSSSDVIIAS